MKVVGLDHVQLAIPEGSEARARTFYRDLLQLPEIPKPQPLAQNGGAWFDNGRVKIHIGIDPDFVPATKAHPALLVEGLDELLARLRAAGVETRLDSSLPGVKRAFVDDPFGNRLELIEQK